MEKEKLSILRRLRAKERAREVGHALNHIQTPQNT